MVSTRPLIYKSSSPCTNSLVIVPTAPITIGIIVTFMFHSFFNSLARSRYLYLFSHSSNFTLWSAGTTKFTILQVLIFLFVCFVFCFCFVFLLLIMIRSGRLVEIWLSVCISKSQRSWCVSFSRTDSGLCIYHLFVLCVSLLLLLLLFCSS